MKTSAVAPALMLALLTVLAAIAPAAASAGTVSIKDLAHLTPDLTFNGSPSAGYRPVMTSVRAGGTVTFTNIGLGPHTVTSFSTRAIAPPPLPPLNLPVPDGVFDSSPSVPVFSEQENFADQINPGQSFTVDTGALNLATGTYMIFCKFHPWMVGAIVVLSDGPSTVSARITDSFGVGHGRQAFAGSATWSFLSRTTTVKQGTTVVWTNDGFIPHTVTSAVPGQPEGSAFNSGLAEDPAHYLFPGMTFSVDTSSLPPGVYPYECDLHPWMQGTLIVLG